MTSYRPLLHRSALVLLLGWGASWAAAQVELPPVRTSGSSRGTLERPPSYEPANRPSSTVYSRSSSRGTSRIPDPMIFDGSDFPEEERPEQAQIAQFEMPGGEPPPPTKNEQGPGEQQGGGGQGPGGDGGPQGGGGPQMAGGPQIPGLPPIMGGGAGGEEGEEQGQGGAGSPPPIPEGDQGDGGGEGPEGEPGEGGGQEGPEAPEGAEGRQLEKPGEIQIGHEGAQLAEADTPQAAASQQLENAQGEDRMKVKAASGSQSGNKGKGTERGVDIPSNL